MRWIAILFCLLIAACTSSPPRSKQWQGATTKLLFKKLGYPTRIARLREGRCLLIYERKAPTCTALFKVNSEKKIVSVSYRGDQQCPKLFS